MTHPRFDFDSFDKLCDEALAEDKAMMEEGVGIEEAEHWAEHDSLGATVVQLARLPDPPEAA